VTDWHSALPAQGALAEFIDQGGFARHIRKLRSIYEKRHDLIHATLALGFAEYLEVIPSAAGLHLTALVRGPYARNTPKIVRRASDLGVEVHELSRIAARAGGQHGLMLGYGAIPTNDIPEGLRLLRLCFDDL